MIAKRLSPDALPALPVRRISGPSAAGSIAPVSNALASTGATATSHPLSLTAGQTYPHAPRTANVASSSNGDRRDKQAADEAADTQPKRQNEDRHQLGVVTEAAQQRALPAELNGQGRDA